jgi:predicted O-methyltransferase YrrM
MILHAAHLWRRWTHLTEAVSGEESRSVTTPPPNEEGLRAFIGAMHAIAALMASRIVTAVNPAGARALLDVGGASGTYTIAFLQADPKMKATLFDQPPVIEMARKRLAEAGVLDRVSLIPGDFYAEEFPSGHDLAFVSAIIHQNSAEQNSELFKKVLRSLRPGGRIVLRDHIMKPDRTEPISGAVFAVNMLLATEGGNTYTFEELERGLTQAGFGRVRLIQKGEHMDGLVEGFKPWRGKETEMGDKKNYRVKTFTNELKVFHAMNELAALDEQVNQFIAANHVKKVISASDTTTTDNTGATIGVIRVLVYEAW